MKLPTDNNQGHINNVIQPPEWVLKPSPAIFTLAWAIFTLSAATLYHIRRRDIYQNHILAATMTIGLLGTSVLSDLGIQEALGTQLPCWIGLGLLVSMVGHQVAYGTKEGRRRLEQEHSEEASRSELDFEKF
jgi:hypothetical protein